MANRTIVVPSFDFSAFYYPQLLESLIQFKRRYVPELTDESDFEPFIQAMRAFALVGHLNNTLIDVIANESTLPTAQLAETVRQMLALIDYRMRAASPSATDVVFELSKTFSSTFELIPEAARLATESGADEVEIPFEIMEALSIVATDEFTSVFRESAAGAFTDHTAAANAGSGFTPVLNTAGDKLYFGHSSVMWNELDIDVTVAQANLTGVWEFYDGDFDDTKPDLVTDIGGGEISYDLTTLLGPNNRAGATVRIRSNVTGAYEDVVSTWNGSENIAVTGYLGQTSPTTDVDDYQVGVAWTELELDGLDFEDETAALTLAGVLSYGLPQTELLNWKKATVNGQEAFWIRWRTITSVGGTNPTLDLCRLDTGKQYVIALATQGRTVQDDPLGSSTGGTNQSFATSRDNFIDGSEIVTVDNEIWTRVTDFLSSTAQDRHYRIVLGEKDRASVTFGDGTSGRIPTVGQGNISIEYRVDANNDGNVGATKIKVDKAGLTFVNSLYNPRQAGGWSQAQGATPESLEQAKIEGPASLRAKEVAISPEDAVTLAKKFVSSAGTKPFTRATFIEEGFGPKTLALIVVGGGGIAVSQTLLDELDLYFNGDKFAVPPLPKRIVTNQEATSVNYTPKVINIVATVTAPESVTEADIINRLAQILQPEALKDDGVTYEWDFGGEVGVSRINHEIFETDDLIEKVVITDPPADVGLNPTELPMLGTVTITMVEP
jgi:hypothetical protein